MPSVKDMLGSSLKGFAAVENPRSSPPAELPGRMLGGNPYRRCPLPPLAATVDTLRQFDESGKIPTRRVIPLPLQTSGTGNSITNVNTTINESGGGSSASGSLVAAQVVFNSPALPPGGSFRTTVQMAKSFQLLQLISTQPVNIRVYGNLTTQNSDIVRLPDTAVPFETLPGIITDVVFDVAPFRWGWQNRTGANSDPTQTATIYVTVINPSQTMGASASTITIEYAGMVK